MVLSCYAETLGIDRDNIGRRNYKDEDYTPALHHTKTHKTPPLHRGSESIAAINRRVPLSPCNIVTPTMERQIRINVPAMGALRLYLTSISPFLCIDFALIPSCKYGITIYVPSDFLLHPIFDVAVWYDLTVGGTITELLISLAGLPRRLPNEPPLIPLSAPPPPIS
ncbi:unnamed protein product [Nezara viridula]|uniref:Uncharacterized protein n=1 Tax=Nezara viridula TaxID=85310 RepID=A0A9P0HGK3_NEZVI|nr:unnamed protein product [Nezara viridula]